MNPMDRRGEQGQQQDLHGEGVQGEGVQGVIPDDRPATAAPEPCADASADSGTLIAALRTAGAHRFDPVGWHYIDALAGRALAHQGSVRRLLEARLMRALATCERRFRAAQAEAGTLLARAARQHPHAADELQALFDAGDFGALRRRCAALQADLHGASLRALVQQLEQQAPASTEAPAAMAGPAVASGPEAPAELKAIRHFRQTWSRLSVDRQVAQALRQAPKNAGPINSHMLVLRSLSLMRDAAPAYLDRFLSYAETLLCLEQGDRDKPAPAKKAAPRAAKK